MDNVGRILKDRHISVNGLLALIHDRHPDCGLPYSILRRLVSHEQKMSIDEAILICDALDIPFTALFDFAGEVPHGPLKGMTSADIYRACDAAGTWHTIGNHADPSSSFRWSVHGSEHGKVAFTVPDMGEFILRAAPSDGQAYDGRRSNVD